MKKSILFCIITILLTFISIDTKAQNISEILVKNSNGICISYFNANDLDNWKSIFVCKEFQIAFPNDYYKQEYSIKITNKDSLINRLEHLVTKKFIEDLNTCCSEKNCPDSINGYWIILKVNDEEYSQCIDKVFISRELCGNETLDEVLDIFDKLSSE